MKESQQAMILNGLMTGLKITALDGLKWYGCIRVPNRISELRQLGFQIQDEWFKIKTRYGNKQVKIYWMENLPSKKLLAKFKRV